MTIPINADTIHPARPEYADVYSDDGYYAVVPEWILDATISAQAVRLYAVLRRYADQRTMFAHPSRKTLAGRLQVKDEKVVDRALADLQEIGAVTVIARWRNEEGQVVYAPDAEHREQTSNAYRLNRRPYPSEEVGGGGVSTPTPPSLSPHPGGAAAPGVGAQKGDKPQPSKPQPSEPQIPTPSELGPASENVAQLPLVDAPAKPAKGKRKVRIEVPLDWEPSPELCAWTRTNYPGMPREEVAAFRDKHRSVGNTFLDLDAAWRTWARNWKKYGPRGGGRPAPYRNPQPQQQIGTTDGPPASDGWDDYISGGQNR